MERSGTMTFYREKTDLREWIEKVRELGELREINGVDWNLEMGAITELAFKGQADRPAIIFDEIKDYPKGYRVLVNLTNSLKKLALTLGMDLDLTPRDFILGWKEKAKSIKPIPPRVVKDGPVLENVLHGKDVNLYKLPAPHWHEHDGGRYIGTAGITVTRDPEEGWVNFGVYRVVIHDENTLGFYISPGKHGRIHREKYYNAKKPCPVAISFGHDPLFFLVGGIEVPFGYSEYDYAGGLFGKPIEVIEGEVTGLPVPARSEIVIEGESIPGDNRMEGPFGEWPGYYSSSQRPEPVIKVKSIMHRHNPILCGAPPCPPPTGSSFYRGLMRSAMIWEELEKSGIPDIRGVRCHEKAGHRFMTIVSIKQRYPGHAKQVGMIASQCRGAAYLGRFVIVVDEDIDIFNNDEVLWAMATRCDPQESIDIIRRAWSGPLDPAIPLGKKGHNSRAIIEACRPYEWIDKFPRSVESGPELKAKILKKWGKIISM